MNPSQQRKSRTPSALIFGVLAISCTGISFLSFVSVILAGLGGVHFELQRNIFLVTLPLAFVIGITGIVCGVRARKTASTQNNRVGLSLCIASIALVIVGVSLILIMYHLLTSGFLSDIEISYS
jgi:hypothetical protein